MTSCLFVSVMIAGLAWVWCLSTFDSGGSGYQEFAWFNETHNTVQVNTTLLKSYDGAKVFSIEKILIRDQSGKEINGVPTPSEIVVNKQRYLNFNLRALWHLGFTGYQFKYVIGLFL